MISEVLRDLRFSWNSATEIDWWLVYKNLKNKLIK
jgi:hypothetical protein